MTTLLALDPSTTRTGYAVFRNGRAIEFGAFNAPKNWSPEDKITAFVKDLRDVCDDFDPDVAVIEFPNPTPYKHAKHQAKYGVAVGRLWGVLIEACGADNVDTPSVAEWKETTSKEQTMADIESRYPTYDKNADKKNGSKGDIADAIALGEFWLLQQRLRKAAG